MKNSRNLILCSGTSEYLYSKSLQMDLPEDTRRLITVENAIHCESSPINLVREGIMKKRLSRAEKNPYENIWLFFQNSDLVPGIVPLMQKNNLRPAYCPICIEQWYCLHFKEYLTTLETAEEVSKELVTMWPQYKKNRVDAFLELKDRLPTAFDNAQKASGFEGIKQMEGVNPLFTIQHLVTFFQSFKAAS